MAEKNYSATPLSTKLGIKDGAQVALIGSPPGFREVLSLPRGIHVHSRPRGQLDVIVFFTTQRSELGRRFRGLAHQLTEGGGLWIAWPKKASSVETNLDFDTVQRHGLAESLVDNKSCSIDEDWQALRFVRRREDRRSSGN
jgi:hypothetical protein